MDGKDTWVWSSVDFSHATHRELRTNQTASFDQFILIEFSDFPGVVAGSTINSATLELFNYDNFTDLPLDLKASQITSAWVETVTFLTHPTVNATPEDITEITIDDVWYSWDLTSLTQDWVDATASNYGVQNFDSGPGHFQRFASSDIGGGGVEPAHPGGDLRPKLTIDFMVPMPPSNVIPESSSLLLWGIGLVGIVIMERRRRKQKLAA